MDFKHDDKKISRKVILMILDGWGIGDHSRNDAVFCAPKPNLDEFFEHYPNSCLKASGLSVGLPEGVMGNSEVGHLNLGAGRVIYQDLVRINLACADGSLANNTVLLEAFGLAKQPGRRLHFIGLLSDAGVHSMSSHLYKLCELASQNGLRDIFVHALGDGRDSDPRSGLGFVKEAEEKLGRSNAVLSTMIGRYYTMDRDKRWERIKEGYDLMTSGSGHRTEDFISAIEESYAAGITDEFLRPLVKTNGAGDPVGLIRPDDVVICFNFRTERLREITVALTQKDMPEFGLQTMPLHYYTLTKYDDSFVGVKAIFEKDKISNTLGEIVSRSGLRQLRLAETEKYAHVTFFFSGGREEKFVGEERILIPSPKVATYDLQPEMSAFAVKDALISNLAQDFSFICLNFANCDMVGHTGNYPAIIKAVESVDTCVGEAVRSAQAHGYDVLIIADHGNAESAVNPDGSPNTAHSLNPVPCLLISSDYKKIRDGILADIAPTILKMMGLAIPDDMTGQTLV
jgi:2,3-bisphosphoglycerate-independent phosphoglycerate mutase